MPPQPFEAVLDALDALQPAVRLNSADFAAFGLSVAYLAHLYRRRSAGWRARRCSRRLSKSPAGMAALLAADWQAGPSGDPLAGFDQLAAWGFGPEDWIHGRFLASAR